MRSSINAQVFRRYLKTHHADATENFIPMGAVVIKSKAEWKAAKRDFYNSERKILYEKISEADVKDTWSGRADPFLCLFYHCHVMCCSNENVSGGVANGTTALFEGICLKEGRTTHPIQVDGMWVHAVDVDDIEYMKLRWYDCKFTGSFQLKPTRRLFKVMYPVQMGDKTKKVPTSVYLTCFAINLNTATTGFKLQGSTVEYIVIAQWSKVKNFAYVLLSRCRKLAGLFLLEPLPTDINFVPEAKYSSMMSKLRSKIATVPLSFDNMMSYFQSEGH